MLVWLQSIVGVTIPGTKPTFTNIQNLLQFNGSSGNSGLSGLVLNTAGTITYTNDTPLSNGQAAVFNGSSGLYNDNGPIAGTGAYSLACWVKPIVLSGASYLISQRDAQNTGQYSLLITPAGISFVDGNSASTTGPSVAMPLPTGTWSHVAAVRANGVMRLYVNGAQVASFNKTAATIISTNGLCIGYDQRDGNKFLNGYMKDVVVANRELTADEILWMAKSNSYFPTS